MLYQLSYICSSSANVLKNPCSGLFPVTLPSLCANALPCLSPEKCLFSLSLLQDSPVQLDVAWNVTTYQFILSRSYRHFHWIAYPREPVGLRKVRRHVEEGFSPFQIGLTEFQEQSWPPDLWAMESGLGSYTAKHWAGLRYWEVAGWDN